MEEEVITRVRNVSGNANKIRFRQVEICYMYKSRIIFQALIFSLKFNTVNVTNLFEGVNMVQITVRCQLYMAFKTG